MVISIIIPTKNEQDHLPILLDSISKQGLSKNDLEVIVADANSKDRTVKIARDYGCLVVPGGTPAEGRNKGAYHAKGDILIFKDSDSPLPSNFLQPALKEFRERGLDVAGTLQYPFSSKTGFTALRYKLWIGFFANGYLNGAENTSSPLMQNCMFARRAVHEAIGGFNEALEFGEDSEYAKRAKANGYTFGILRSCGEVGFSMRRFDENELKMLLKNALFTTGRKFGHEFRKGKSPINYWE